ncbi:MAG: FkbM family methyltransferase [Planctomycetaceae bacterium]
MRWITGSCPHGAWIGLLERGMLRQFTARLREGSTVWDIGANVGLYTLASSRAVGNGGRVYAFEPMPRNLEHLRRHIAMNGLANVIVVPSAASDADGMLRMAEGDSPSEFHADERGEFEIEAIALDRWQSECGGPPPEVVKIDVEGAETQVLRGAATTFSRDRPVIFLALHGDAQRRDCRELLTGWGYRIRPAGDADDVEHSSEWLAEPI